MRPRVTVNRRDLSDCCGSPQRHRALVDLETGRLCRQLGAPRGLGVLDTLSELEQFPILYFERVLRRVGCRRSIVCYRICGIPDHELTACPTEANSVLRSVLTSFANDADR